jgi:hypothetical protein
MRHLWIILTLLGLLSLAWGLRQGQFSAVRRFADTLCTSCIGLAYEEGRP